MLEQMIALTNEINERPEFFSNLAKMYKQMYDALLAEGFSEAQAMEILARQGAGITR